MEKYTGQEKAGQWQKRDITREIDLQKEQGQIYGSGTENRAYN